MSVESYVSSRLSSCSSDSPLAPLWTQVRDLYVKKLWHQLTQVLESLVQRPEMEKELVPLYHKVIQDFETKLRPLSLVCLLVPIGRSIEDDAACLDFLLQVSSKVKADNEACALAMTMQATEQLKRGGDKNKVQTLIDDVKVLLDQVDRVGKVHQEYYKVCSDFHKSEGNHALFYQSCLRYLGCSDLSQEQEETHRNLAFYLSLAALLAEEVFNFGELLAHPVVKYLKNPNDEWLLNLLCAFNQGDVAQFNALKESWGKQPDLKANEAILFEKVCLLALLNMTFDCSATKRQLSFDAISLKTGLEKDKVEFLVLKALSRKLLRGDIDQVQGNVNVTWVHPRVLGTEQLEMLMTKIDQWTGSIKSMESLIHERAEDILTV